MDTHRNGYVGKNGTKPGKIALKCAPMTSAFQGLPRSRAGRQTTNRDRRSPDAKDTLEEMGEAS